MGCEFEFDKANRILLARIDGLLTAENLAEYKNEIYRYYSATQASAQIIDFSAAQYDLSTESVREMAREQSPYSPEYPRVVISPSPLGYGLSRMYQMVGQDMRRVAIVRNLSEAIEELGARSCHFEPLPTLPPKGEMEEAS